MIVTGGAAHNQFYEADCMRRMAIEQGVPADAVVEEKQAQDTIQNIWFSKQIMDAHGWRSAEVVSSPSHLPRTALILEHYKGQGCVCVEDACRRSGRSEFTRRTDRPALCG